jgi:hypothetical protein
MKHEAESKTNAYWLSLLAHLQSSSVPRKVNLFLFIIANSQELHYRNKLILYLEFSCNSIALTFDHVTIIVIFLAYNQSNLARFLGII